MLIRTIKSEEGEAFCVADHMLENSINQLYVFFAAKVTILLDNAKKLAVNRETNVGRCVHQQRHHQMEWRNDFEDVHSVRSKYYDTF